MTALLAVLLFASCSADRLAPDKKVGVPDHCIELTLANIHPSIIAKAGHARGDTTYHENLVETVDCFFYLDGATDQNAVFSALGRGAEPAAEGDSTIYKIKVFFTDADAIRMFGSKESGTCQVYVICNAPLSYDMNHSSVPELKELVVENDFSAQTIQASFVMPAEEPATVTLTTTGSGNNAVRSATGRVHVKRSAAKMQLFLDIPELFVDESNQEWEPVWEAGIQIMMANEVKRGKVDGNYQVQSSDYVSTEYRNIMKLDTVNRVPGMLNYAYTHVPFYSYPSAWTDLSDYAANFVFRIPWRIKGETGYTWKVYQLSPNLVGQKFEANHYYRTFCIISSLGGADKDHNVVIPECDYYVLDWMNESASAGGQGEVPGELVTYTYLVVDEPNITLENEETAKFTYVSSSPISGVTITKILLYDNTKSPALQTLTSGTDFNNAKNQISINTDTPGLVTFTHSLSNVYSQWTIYATVSNEENCSQDVTIVQNPSIRLERTSMAGNIFVNGYFARVDTRPPGWSGNTNSFTEDNVRYYHCASFWANTNGGQINNSTQTKNGRTTGTYGTILGSTNNLSSSIDRNFYTTYIMVSSFSSSNDYYVANNEEIHYRIGDPRVPSSTHYSGTESWTNNSKLYDYLYYNGSNNTELFAAWNDPENILITSQTEDAHSILAPRFLVSSALNANTGLTFEQAVKRGATYQEAGYPAGRWRLPTEAEIAFIVARQKEGAIPVLYATNSDYWSGSGRLVYVPADANASISFSTPAANATQSCRFVYDLWYWGDEAAETNVYHPNGHNTSY